MPESTGTSEEFCEGLWGLMNPHGDGWTGQMATQALQSIFIDDRLLRKKFVGLLR